MFLVSLKTAESLQFKTILVFTQILVYFYTKKEHPSELFVEQQVESDKKPAKSNKNQVKSKEKWAKSNEQRAKSNEKQEKRNEEQVKTNEQQAKTNEQRAINLNLINSKSLYLQ